MRARVYARIAHGNQKYGEHPYIVHLDDVAQIARETKLHDFERQFLTVCAYLHDVIEDTPISLHDVRVQFNDEVADVVWAVTSEQGVNRKERNAKTYPKIKASFYATVLKLCDRLANVRRCVSGQSSQLEMYRKEHANFREALYSKHPVMDELWNELDALLNQ